MTHCHHPNLSAGEPMAWSLEDRTLFLHTCPDCKSTRTVLVVEGEPLVKPGPLARYVRAKLAERETAIAA